MQPGLLTEHMDGYKKFNWFYRFAKQNKAALFYNYSFNRYVLIYTRVPVDSILVIDYRIKILEEVKQRLLIIQDHERKTNC